jgi:hypothetical protein
MVMAALASACNAAVKTQPVPTQGQGQSKPTKLPQPTKTRKPTKTQLPTDTRSPGDTALPTDTAEPAPTPALSATGLSRNNPYPRSAVVPAPNWDVQVMEVKRGEEAWSDIQAASEFNEAAPEGMEYLLVKVHVKSTQADGDEHSLSSCDFNATGDRLISYMCGMAVEPDPVLDVTVTTGGEAEGWAAYLVGQDEKNLILVFNEAFTSEENAVRYIALDKGAAIGVSPDLAAITPTDLGRTQDHPAARTDQLTTQDWELSVKDVLRGEEAWTMIQDANPFNDPPAQGMEYIAVNIHVRSIASVDQAESIDGSYFQSTGSAGVFYDSPPVAGPNPSLDIALFPGGEYEGWIVLQAAKGETGVLLVFKPWLDESDENQRFLRLEP